MCIWCEKTAPLVPMVSGAKMPMICSDCGTKVCMWGWSEMRDLILNYEKRVQMLEEALEKERSSK